MIATIGRLLIAIAAVGVLSIDDWSNEGGIPTEEVRGLDAFKLETERVEFIRRAAIELCCVSPYPDPSVVWTAARMLWEAKPKDC